MYRLLFYESKALQKDRKKLLRDKKISLAVQEVLAELSINPFAHHLPVKKLQGAPQEGTFRLRCGSWRVLFDVDTKNRTILVYRIKQRKEGY